VTKRGRHYHPIDELLLDLCFMILRTVRRFDWAEAADIKIALNIPGDDVDHHRSNSFDVLLSRMTRRGYLERTGRPMAYQYRISEAGRREYERQLGRNAA